MKSIELKHIDKFYGDVRVIEGLNLRIESSENGKFVVVVGPSGCGKSTLLRFISSLDTPTNGYVTVGDLPVEDNNIQVGQVFQKYSSFPWRTVLDNVSLGLEYQGVSKKERRERSMEMIKRVGLEGHEMKFAQYPDLSGGQLQRVAIARSLLANPEILLMDEPFGALDVKTRLQMQDLINELFTEYKPTVVMVTHDLQEAVYLADDIYIMCKPPSSFVKHLHIDLPLERDRNIKRDPKFLQYVHQLEDVMMEME